MPIYMDLHIVPGVNAKNVAEAHSRDVFLEKDHNCTCLTYWVDESRGHVFCLIDAPSKEAVYTLHNRSHGLVPHKIIEVQTDFVQSFLGRITDPETGKYTDDGLLLLDDSSYRMVLAVSLPDPALLHHQLGKEKALYYFQKQREIVRDAIAHHQGKEVLQEGPGVIGSFITAENALSAALQMNEQLKNQYPNYRIHIQAGEPVTQHDALFGETLQFLHHMDFLRRPQPVGMSSGVRELVPHALLQASKEIYCLSGSEEDLLNTLFQALEKQYANPDLSLDDYAQTLAMSQSQLYRKTTALTGQSPNDLLKVFRLSKARDLLKKGKQNINEIAYDCGFNSPSYFTKCFKKEFSILPMDYMNLV